VKVIKDVKEQRKGTSNKVPKGFFRIDRVENHREKGGETEYLVRWKGYDESHDEWKKEQDVTSTTLDEYREQLKRTKIENAQQKGEECKKEELEEQHKLDIDDETDEKFFRRVRTKKGKRKHSTDYRNTPQNPEKQVCRYRFANGCEEIRKAHTRNAGSPRM
jgi:hypothetical protein